MLKITGLVSKNKEEFDGFGKLNGELNKEEKYIFLSNHVSYMDVMLLDKILPSNTVFFVPKEEKKKYYEVSKRREVMGISSFHENDIKEVKIKLDEGKNVLIFPEGRISTTGNVMKIYKEIGQILKYNENYKVYPIVISGAEKTKESPLYEIYKPSGEVHIKVKLGDEIKRSKIESESNISNVVLRSLQHTKFMTLYKSDVNLFDELLEIAKAQGEKKEIVEDENLTLTYNKLILSSYVLGERIEKELKEEEKVGLMLPTTAAFMLAFFGLIKAGKTPALLNFTMGPKGIKDSVETVGLKTIVTSSAFVKKANLQEVIEELGKEIKIMYIEEIKERKITKIDKAIGMKNYLSSQKAKKSKNEVILYTSGSEAKPKGVVLSHTNLLANAYQAISTIDILPNDKLFNAMPVFHSFGLTVGTILPIMLGIPVYAHPSPISYKEIPELIYKKDATVLFGTSTFLSGYQKYADIYDLRKLKHVVVGAEKLRDDVREAWLKKYGIKILEGYGVTETAPVISLNTPHLQKDGTVGTLVPGMEYKINKIEGIQKGGTLLVKGPNVMKGYILEGKGYVPLDEWHDTGDVVFIDEEGFITIQSRLKRFAKIGGEMVSLNIVEQLAEDFTGESAFAAVSVSDKRKGEKIILYTTREKELKERELKKFIKQSGQSALHIPKHIIKVDEFPILGTGKRDYVTLQQIAKKEFE